MLLVVIKIKQKKNNGSNKSEIPCFIWKPMSKINFLHKWKFRKHGSLRNIFQWVSLIAMVKEQFQKILTSKRQVWRYSGNLSDNDYLVDFYFFRNSKALITEENWLDVMNGSWQNQYKWRKNPCTNEFKPASSIRFREKSQWNKRNDPTDSYC